MEFQGCVVNHPYGNSFLAKFQASSERGVVDTIYIPENPARTEQPVPTKIG
ncbi:MAG: hypothetical protein ACFE68_09130 [Candidatus Hodarchaeota archaeon]